MGFAYTQQYIAVYSYTTNIAELILIFNLVQHNKNKAHTYQYIYLLQNAFIDVIGQQSSEKKIETIDRNIN